MNRKEFIEQARVVLLREDIRWGFWNEDTRTWTVTFAGIYSLRAKPHRGEVRFSINEDHYQNVVVTGQTYIDCGEFSLYEGDQIRVEAPYEMSIQWLEPWVQPK